MTKYVNKTNRQQQIRFEDGTGVFLKKGQTVSVNKKVKKIDSGIVEKKEEKKTTTSTASTTTAAKTESKENE